MSVYSTVLSPAHIPQSEPLDNRQKQNEAGGYTYEVDDFTRLNRFLILGSEGGCYYATERALTKDNAEAVIRAIKADGERTVREIVAVSQAGRAPKNDPAIFALALALSIGDASTQAAAVSAVVPVCRTFDHLTKLLTFIKGNSLRGFGPRLRRAIGSYYTDKPLSALALHAVKYPTRNGYSHKDMLRLAHAWTSDPTRLEVWEYMKKGWPEVGETPHPNTDLRVIWAAEQVQKLGAEVSGEDKAGSPSRVAAERDIAAYVNRYSLPLEVVPTHLRTAEVYRSILLDFNTRLTWLMRNLSTMTRLGVLGAGKWKEMEMVERRLTDPEGLRTARLHPLSILIAQRTYEKGQGKGENGWTPEPAISSILSRAFEQSFQAVTPSGKRFVLAVDISGSMGTPMSGVPLTCREAAAAMALVTLKTEQNVETVAFDTVMRRLPLTKSMGVGEATNLIAGSGWSGGGTDCAQPMLWAMENNTLADVFICYTDSQTWAGIVHPMEALKQYRKKTGIAAKLIVCAMVANKHTIGDTDDAGVLDVVGFDTATPQLIADFAAGSL